MFSVLPVMIFVRGSEIVEFGIFVQLFIYLFVFHEEFVNDHIYETDFLSDMHG